MKILHIGTSTRGGAGTGMSRLHLALRENNLNSRILCLDGNTDPHVTTCSRRTKSKLARAYSKLFSQNFLSPSNEFAPEVFSSPTSEHNPEDHPWVQESDVIHLHWVYDLVDYSRFFKQVTQPIVWTLHDQNPYLGGFHYKWEQHRFPELAPIESKRLTYKRKALNGRPIHVVGNSEWNTKHACNSEFFTGFGSFQTIYYPLPRTDFFPVKKSAARESLGLPADACIIGFACHDLKVKRKGYEFMHEVLSNLKDIKNTYLLTFGSASDMSLKPISCMQHLHLGSVNAPALQRLIYSAMTCFLVPSRAEAFGQTAIEARACGTRVIGSNVGGLSEALAGGSLGTLCPPDDQKAWIEAITNALHNPSFLNFSEMLYQRHEPSSIAQQYLKVYQKALQ